MNEKKETVCPCCGKTVITSNFCPHCAYKLVEVCDCWMLHKPFNCGSQGKCPGRWLWPAACLIAKHSSEDGKALRKVITEPISEKEETTNSTWSETLENEDVKVTFIIEPKSSNLNKVLHGIAKKSQRAYLDFATDMGNKHSWFASKKVNADV